MNTTALHPATRQIVRSLTKAQRRMVIVGGVSGDARPTTAAALASKGLMYLDIDSPNGRYGFFRLTSLGKRVQEALKS